MVFKRIRILWISFVSYIERIHSSTSMCVNVQSINKTLSLLSVSIHDLVEHSTKIISKQNYHNVIIYVIRLCLNFCSSSSDELQIQLLFVCFKFIHISWVNSNLDVTQWDWTQQFVIAGKKSLNIRSNISYTLHYN